ncbi:MAG: homoserine kinase [Prevotellaceae bacterium]|jgi:homoserine kinase|nr:homoserine kinase [Prevotellaceae bacterium]
MIKIFSPATVANVACGFDVLGFALHTPGDQISMALNNTGRIELHDQTPYRLPLTPEKNVTAVALQSMLDALHSQQGFTITFLSKIMPGSGVGSSAASAAAAVFGANELLGRPFTRPQLVPFAMQGERAASGTAHADNVAPALLGGFTLIRSYTPLDIIPLPHPPLYATIVHPQIEVRTSDSRKILRQEVPIKKAIQQWGNLAGLVAGLFTNDYQLIGRSLHDVIIEPVRALLIPEFYAIKQAAIDAGALGCSISGSGPSIFALSPDEATARQAAQAMHAHFDRLGIDSHLFVSPINREGVKIMENEG